MKKPSSLVCLLVFAISCVILFSGQRRAVTATPPRPVQQRPAQRLPQPPPKEEPQATIALPELPLVVVEPDKIPWRPFGSNAAPVNHTLVGNPAKAELYVTRTRFPRGKKTLPHVHPDDRTVVVISGTYHYGIGEVFDETRMIALPPGTFLTEPAGQPHFSWAKDGEVVVQTTAIGPTGTTVLPDSKEQPRQTRRP